MASFSFGEYADIIMAYGAAGGNARAAQRIYQEQFPNRRLPGRRVFQDTYRRIHERGKLSNDEPRGIVIRHNVRVDEQILQLFQEDPMRSIRAVAAMLDISVWKVWHVLRVNEQHAFHLNPVQG